MPALITNAVGSYPKPEYLAQARSQFSQGKIDRAELDKLERKATEYWIRSQERIGLDVLVHGEMERGDMVAYFAGEPGGNPIGGMKLGGLVRSYGNRYYHKPIIVYKLTWPGPMTVDMWRYAQSLTDRPVKGMLTGAYTMVEWSFDDYYPSRRAAVLDMAPIIRREVEELVKDGIRRTLKLFPPERLWIYPDCGLKTRTTDEAEAKLQVMVDAERDIKRELEIE